MYTIRLLSYILLLENSFQIILLLLSSPVSMTFSSKKIKCCIQKIQQRKKASLSSYRQKQRMAIKTANRVNLVVKNPCSLPAQSLMWMQLLTCSSSGVSSSLSPGTAPQSKTRRSRKTTQSTTHENQSKKRVRFIVSI